jgi:hypothetical protein
LIGSKSARKPLDDQRSWAFEVALQLEMPWDVDLETGSRYLTASQDTVVLDQGAIGGVWVCDPPPSSSPAGLCDN